MRTGPAWRAWVVWSAAMTLSALGLALLALTLNAPVPDSWGFRGFTVPFAVCFGTLGLAIVLARGNPIGWIFVIGGLLAGLQAFAEEYAIYGALDRPTPLPGAVFLAWFESWMWVVMVSLVAIYVPLLFPSGRLPSPRWRPFAIAPALVALVLILGLAFNEGPLNNAPFIVNPFGIPGLHLIDTSGGAATPDSTGFFVLYALLFACAAAAAWSLVGRFHEARGIERQQIKWFGFGAGITAITMIVGGSFQEYKAAQILFIMGIQLVPITIAVAILRHRLFDIDFVIDRALVYGVTISIVGAGFVLAALFLQTVLRPITQGNDIAIAISTLATVAAFQPLRRWVQGAIDRRFYRSRYDAVRTLDAFAARLRDEVDLETVRRDLLGAVDETVRPRHAGVWLRVSR